MTSPTPPFLVRLWLVFSCALRLLFDAAFASRVLQLRAGTVGEPSVDAGEPEPGGELVPEPPSAATVDAVDPVIGAMQLLAALQREGRFIDFVEQEIDAFDDADIGAAARVVHAGCRQALRRHVRIEVVCDRAEGAELLLEPGFDPQVYKLTGNLSGNPPHRGIVRHRGWRASKVNLPELVEGRDGYLLAAAEVEL